MNELMLFNNDEFGEIRGVEIEGKPYVVASDVAKALGYKGITKKLRLTLDRLILEDKIKKEINGGDIVYLLR